MAKTGISGNIPIDFDDSKECKTTGYHNNCGPACLTHFFAAKLQSGEIQQKFSNDPQYQLILRTFQEYYKLPTLPTWDDIQQLFASYPVPTDREAIFGPVLRLAIAKTMQEEPDLWWAEGSAALSDYLSRGRVDDIALPIFRTNREKFEELAIKNISALFEKSHEPFTSEETLLAAQQLVTKKIDDPSEAQIAEQIQLQRKNAILDKLVEEGRQYWIQEDGGCQRYTRYLSDQMNDVMISADQLSVFCKALSIGLEVYTPDSIAHATEHTHGAQNLPEPGYTWLFRVKNGGAHWEFEHPDPDYSVVEHNQHYPLEYVDEIFYANKSLSGEFGIYGEPQYRVGESRIQDVIRQNMNQIAEAKIAAQLQVPETMSAPIPMPLTTALPPHAKVADKPGLLSRLWNGTKDTWRAFINLFKKTAPPSTEKPLEQQHPDERKTVTDADDNLKQRPKSVTFRYKQEQMTINVPPTSKPAEGIIARIKKRFFSP